MSFLLWDKAEWGRPYLWNSIFHRFIYDTQRSIVVKWFFVVKAGASLAKTCWRTHIYSTNVLINRKELDPDASIALGLLLTDFGSPTLMIKILVIAAVLGLLIFAGWFTYEKHTLTPILAEQTILAEPGATVLVRLEDYVSGDIAEHQLIQLSGSIVTITATDSGYTIALPPHARGEQISLQLSAGTILSNVQTQIHIVTEFLQDITDIAIGNDAQCIRDRFGFFCWGGDSYGQSSKVPSRFTRNGTLIAGHHFFCGIEDNRLTCWGELETDVKLKNMTAIATGAAGLCYVDKGVIQCHAPRGEKNILHNLPDFAVSDTATLSVGGSHACVLDRGILHCWGKARSTLTNVPLDLIYPTKITSGYGYNCTLDSGQIRCWGDGQFDTRMPSLTNITDIKANGYRLCALSNNNWYCWEVSSGVAARYQKSVYRDSNNIQIFKTGICTIDAGQPDCDGPLHPMPHTVKDPHYLRQDGHKACFIDQEKIVCVGENPYELKRYTSLANRGPVTKFDFDASSGLRCATFKNSATQCFESRNRGAPQRIEGDLTDLDVTKFVCAITDKKARCFGNEINDKLKQPPPLIEPRKIKTAIKRGFKEGTTSGFACVLDQNQLKCWGDNQVGQLEVPQLKDPIDFDLLVEAGCVISKTESACWGNPVYIPKELPTELTNGQSVSILHQKFCIIDDGNPICAPNSRHRPAPVFLDQVKELQVGMRKNCAINASGVTCWGDQYFRYGIDYTKEDQE